MAIWYSVGTATVTANSRTVTFAGGAQVVGNGNPGDVLAVVGYPGVEIETLDSATQVTLAKPWPYAGGGGLAYSIQPTTAVAVLIASRAFAALTAMEAVRDTIGQGMIGDGAVATPALRFASDQDTGLFRLGENQLALSTGGVARITLDAFGNVIANSGGNVIAAQAKGLSVQGLPNEIFTMSDAVMGPRIATEGTFRITKGDGVTEMLRLQGQTGNLGLGTNGGIPAKKLHVAAGDQQDARIRIQNTASGGYAFDLVAGVNGVTQSGFSIYNASTGGTALTIDVNGVVTVPRASEGQMTAQLSSIDNAWRLTTVNGLAGGVEGTTKARLALVFNSDVNNENAAIDFQRGGDGVQGAMAFRTSNVERARITAGGSFLVGATSGTWHIISKNVPSDNNSRVMAIGGAQDSIVVFGVTGGGIGSGAGAAIKVNKDNTTGRSANLQGTMNASGADYAEYVRREDGCPLIAKGDLCGFNRDGHLTRTWGRAIAYGIKSTDPAYVGGDVWSAQLPDRPAEPSPSAPAIVGVEPYAPKITALPQPAAFAPPERIDGEEDDAFTERAAAARKSHDDSVTLWKASVDAVQDAADAYQKAQADWTKASAAHAVALAEAEAAFAAEHAAWIEADRAWELKLETARLTVDRIAFAGQVPVNVGTATLAACESALADGEAVYLIAIARGTGIGAKAVRESEMTLQDLMKRVGRVLAIREGRPWVDVLRG